MISNWHTNNHRLLAEKNKNNSIASSYYVLEKVTRSEFFALGSLGSSVHCRKAFMELHGSARCPSVSDPKYE